LRPKKAKELIPHVASELNLSQNCVTEIITQYWQEIRKSLSSLKHQRIHITNLGDFTIKHWNIDNKIDMLERWEEKSKLKGLQQMTARFKNVETLFDLKNLKKMVEEERQRMEFIKLHKNKMNEPKGKSDKALES
tara:strand:+ start:614 stop:1018 length:405 start_codon:yes stop_codon:yes gene_type:complete